MASPPRITWQVNTDSKVLPELHRIWSDSGTELSGAMTASAPMGAETACKLVQDLILEGMPCDRVNQVTAVTRESFINGFLGTVRPGTHYRVTAEPAGSGAAYHNQITIQ